MIHIFISARGDDIRPGATGKAVPGYEATLLDDNDEPFDGEGEGRLAIAGPTGCRYLADERQRNYVINGWNVTGDIYRRDADGYFWFVCARRRYDHLLRLQHRRAGSGERPAHAMPPSPKLRRCWRSRTRSAAISSRPSSCSSRTPAAKRRRALQDHVKQTIAPYKYPRAIEFVAELPKTAYRQTATLQTARGAA